MRRFYPYFISSLFAVLLVVGSVAQVFAAAKSGNDPRCDGLTGAAYGICTTAIATGCDTDIDNMGCQTLADKFITITGEIPPWSTTLPDCPCGSSETFINRLYPFTKDQKTGLTLTCYDDLGFYLEMDYGANTGLVFSFYPDQGKSKQTCGFDNTSLYVLSDAEAQSCINELHKTADYFGLVCRPVK
jgi:hypothetical protein